MFKKSSNADGQVVLDERLLLSPGLAVKECLEKTNEMAELARDSFKNALDPVSYTHLLL